MLPDVALLDVFDFYVNKEEELEDADDIEEWHTLVHVCRQWRDLVFASPRRLNLRLYCEARTPVRETLGVWPLLPVIIRNYGYQEWGVDNIIAALEHKNPIRDLGLFYDGPSSQLERVLAIMQQPFPGLTRLQLECDNKPAVVPASLLGGSAPLLKSLILDGVSFSGSQKLLLSATHLVDLTIRRTPYSGYISPEAMVTCLSVLTRLENLDIGFDSPRCRPDGKGRRQLPQTRSLLPVLTEFWFRGVGEYLEDIVAHIDAPLLDNLHITFYHQRIFDTPQLARFIGRSTMFKARDKARLAFSDNNVSVTFPQAFSVRGYRVALQLSIICSLPDWQILSLAQVCTLSFPRAFISAVEQLYIHEESFSSPSWQGDIDASQWEDIMHPFHAVKGLYLSRRLVPRTTPALQEFGERVTEVLPVLQTLFLDEPHVQEIIRQFFAARQLASHPIAVSFWVRDFF
jgi:hypothetical protein